jgi:hypothetical protein
MHAAQELDVPFHSGNERSGGRVGEPKLLYGTEAVCIAIESVVLQKRSRIPRFCICDTLLH